VVGLLEPDCHRRVHLVQRRVLEQVVVFQMPLKVILDEHWESVLQERAHFTSIGAVTIAYREKVAVLEPHDVRIRHIRILVDFVRVVRRDASFGSEGELCDNVDNLLFVVASASAVFICILAITG